MLHISLATDENYLHLVHVALESLFATNKSDITIHLLSNNVSVQSLEKVRELVERHNAKISVYPIEDLANLLGVEVPSTISITSYARLFVQSILPQDIDKVLYVDCDVIFTSDISGLYNADLGDSLVGGVHDLLLSSVYRKEIGISKNEPYFNAGILLIPLNTWRKENMQGKFLQYLLNHNGKVFHHDQGIINAVCAGRKLVCEPRYNVISNYFIYPYDVLKETSALTYSKTQYEDAHLHPAIIHFTGLIYGRPWESDCCHPYRDRFLQYKSMTIYKDLPIKTTSKNGVSRVVELVYYKLPFRLYVAFVNLMFLLGHLKRKA